MNLNHTALTCTSEENAERFYEGVLGLKKMRDFSIPEKLTEQIFGLKRDARAFLYGNKDFRVELFIVKKDENPRAVFEHTCLEVKDRQHLIEKCISSGVEVIKIPKGDSFLLFIRDCDGNLFEIKENIN